MTANTGLIERPSPHRPTELAHSREPEPEGTAPCNVRAEWDKSCDAIQIQPLAPDTARRAIREVFDGMSERSRYMRYLGPMPRISTGALSLLSAVDPERHLAWSAVCGGVSVGMVRIVRDRNGEVELAVEVADDHARHGLGRRLTHQALAGAAGWGERSVYLIVHPQNRRAVAMFRSIGAEFRYDVGVLVGDLPVSSDASAPAA